MKLTTDEKSIIEKVTSQFKCPVCGNNQLYFSEQVSYKPFFTSNELTPEEFVKVVSGHCTYCGLMLDFNLGTAKMAK